MLLEIIEENRYSHLVIRNVLDKYNYMEGRDKAFLKRVTEGTLERKIQIDYILNQTSRVPVSKMKPFIRNLLRMSVYQLLYMDNVPDSAVCNEAVKLAGKKGFQNLKGFVNGVLRNIARNRENITWPEDRTEYLSVRYSMPVFLVEKFLKERGSLQTEKLLAQFMEPSGVTIRWKETIREEQKSSLLQEMEKKGVRVSRHEWLPYADVINGAAGISSLPGFAEGCFMVQDVSSMLVCELADIPEGSYVIDVCAAPGGKAEHAAEKLKGTGLVSARDLTEYKTSMILENKARMKADNLEVLVFDARKLRQEDIGKADVLLADLPCSGLGIIGKKTDIKYHVSEEGMKELQELQREILDTVWQYVKPGGVMIYSTCTINPQENEENIKWFTEKYPFTPESLSPYLPRQLKEEGKEGMLQLLPGLSDGFFLARLRRKEEEA
jgi:16S rRNA (cytosine967-C5)-methyltransferase